MITNEIAMERLDKLIVENNHSGLRWKDSRYWVIKGASTAERESVAEELLQKLLLKAGYENVILSGEGRHGDWNVSCQSIDGVARFEVKVAPQNVNYKHQFTSIRHDANYTHLFLLGVMPEKIRFRIIAKSDVGTYTPASRRRDANAKSKITLPPSKLHSFACFKEEVAKVLGSP